MKTIAQHDFTILEAMMDRYGLRELMLMSAHICEEKANHIRENWQDDITAKSWDGYCDKIATLAVKLGGCDW